MIFQMNAGTLILLLVISTGCNFESDKTKPSIPKSVSSQTKKDYQICTMMPDVTVSPLLDTSRPMGGMRQHFWPVRKKVLVVQFLDGDSLLQKKVEGYAREWELYCGMRFEFSKQDKADITITFLTSGCWSLIGTQSLKRTPSMGLGWVKVSCPDNEIRRVVLHEFGHALGLIHEHQNPKNNPFQWNKKEVYQYYAENFQWTSEKVEKNILECYSENQLMAGQYDSNSIMLYAFPAEFTENGYSTKWNSELSEGDKSFIQSIYPN